MKISGSLLSMRDDLNNYIDKINMNNSIDYIHLDIMNTDFVSNYSYSDDEIKTILNKSNKPIDVHLMVKNINKYLYLLKEDKVEYITIHYEAINDFNIINEIRKYKKVGISIKPKTDIKEIYNILDKIDLLLIMSVEPGKGGQDFIEATINKIQLLKKETERRGLNLTISVDGGINDYYIKLLQQNNVDISVVGTYLQNMLSEKI